MESRLTDEDIDWKVHFERIMTNIYIQQLGDAIRRRDVSELQRAYRECRGAGLTPKDVPEMSKARELIEILNNSKRLNEAIDEGNVRRIQSELESVEESAYAKYLSIDINRARFAIQSINRQQQVSMSHVPDLNRSTMSEVRRYKNPAPELHLVIQACLLFLGHDEGTTANWKTCQLLCNPHGRDGLVRKLARFEMNKLNMEIVARVKEILSGIYFTQIQSISAGACTFFVWARGIVDEIEGGSNPEGQSRKRINHTNPLSGIEPADIRRQVEIFRKDSSQSDRKSSYSEQELEEKESSSMKSTKSDTPRYTKGTGTGKAKIKK